MYHYKEVKKPNRFLGKLFLDLCRKYLNYKVKLHIEKDCPIAFFKIQKLIFTFPLY